MYSLNARDHFNCYPPFLMISTTKQMRPNGRGGSIRAVSVPCRLCGLQRIVHVLYPVGVELGYNYSFFLLPNPS